MMFGLLKKKKCEHKWELVGYYYKEYFTEYKNSFDEICAYAKFRCSKCQKFSDHLLSKEEFMPQLHEGRERRKSDYILKLENMGFKQEIELLK